MGEHKRRRLCERLAKEITTSQADRSTSTLGQMVLSTGILHGIGIATTPTAPPSPRSPMAAEGLANGRSKEKNDRWGEVIDLAVGRKTATDENNRRRNLVKPARLEMNIESRQGTRLFRGLRKKRWLLGEAVGDNATDRNDSKAHETAAVAAADQRTKNDEALFTKKLMNVFMSKKKPTTGNRKLWSLGGGRVRGGVEGISRISHAASPKTRSIQTEIETQSSNDGVDSETMTTSAVTIRQPMPVTSMQNPPSMVLSIVGRDESNMQTRCQEDNAKQVKTPANNQSNKSSHDIELSSSSFEDHPTVVVVGVATETDNSVHSLNSRPLSSKLHLNLNASDILAAGVSSPSTSQAPAIDFFSPAIDFQTVSAEVVDVVRRELMRYHLKYESKIQELNEDIKRKQTTIDNLRSALDAHQSD